MSWSPYKKAPNLLLAEMWKELFEAEGTVPEDFEIGQVFPSTLRGLLATAGIGAG